MTNMNLRLKLSEFIGTDIEETVMDSVNTAQNELGCMFKLKLWYDNEEIPHKQLKDFMLKYENKLSYKTSIKPDNSQTYNDFTWFNVVNEEDYKIPHHFRYAYVYSKYNSDGITKGIQKFYEVAKFCTSPKPQKRQKRNDNKWKK